MKHYDYLEPKNNHRKSILWLGFSMVFIALQGFYTIPLHCLLYTSPSPRDRQKSRMPSSA